MSKKKNKRIGIFGGTFNPIHKGHIKIAFNVKKNIKLDEIWFIPTFKTPNKNFFPEKLKPYHRYEMIKRTIYSEDKEWLKVKNFELKSKKVSYTFDTLEQIKKKFPTYKLFFIMGTDRYKDFETWKNYKKIRSITTLIVYDRKDFPFIRKSEKDIYLKNNFLDYSSLEIIKNLEFEKLHSQTLKYISQNSLYLRAIAFYYLSARKYQHTEAVYSQAKRLAKRNFYFNKKRIYTSSFLHDIFKEKDIDFFTSFFKENNLDFPKVHKNILHGIASSVWAENKLFIKDEQILNAVKYHTFPKSKPSKLEKIIFVADKISSDRKSKKVSYYRKLAYLNINYAFEKIIKDQVNEFEKRKIPITSEEKEVYNSIINNSKYNLSYKKTQRKNKKFKNA